MGSTMNTATDLTRRDTIAAYGTMEPASEPGLEGLVQLAATVSGVSYATVNIIDDRWQYEVAKSGSDAGMCAIEDSMCAVVLPEARHVMVPDAREDARFVDNPFVTGVLDEVRFYASSPLITPDGIVIGTLCVFDRVPGDLRPEQSAALDVLAHQVVDVLELRRMTRELGRSNGELSQFAGQISHDLRNPLTALMGQLELAVDGLALDNEPMVSRALTHAESAAMRMNDMVAVLLEYARIGGGELRRTAVDLRTAISAAVDDLSVAIADAAATIAIDAPVTVSGDPTLLRVLFQNLIANSVKFSHASGERPFVEIAAASTPTGCRITVDDNGPGVPEEQRARVFKLMERGDTGNVPGLGLGLATSRRIVQAHGGRIGLESSPLGGARVWIFLPEENPDFSDHQAPGA